MEHIACQSLVSRRLSLTFSKLRMKGGGRSRVRNSEFTDFRPAGSELSNGAGVNSTQSQTKWGQVIYLPEARQAI
jgi:hypothetical protein